MLVGQAIVHVQEANFLAIGEAGDRSIDLVDDWREAGLIVAWKDRRENDRGFWRFESAGIDDGLDAARNVAWRVLAVAWRADIIRTGQDDDHLGMDSVEFSVSESPQDVLGGVGAPTEVGGIPTVEIRVPVF